MQRVVIPLAVIAGTVVGLTGIGWKLFSLKAGGASPTASAIPMNTPVPDSTLKVDRMHVQVLNGTQTAGLGRKTADLIEGQGWVVVKVGNFTGTALKKSVVYFPVGFDKQAATLAKLIAAETKPAEATMAKDLLTLVVAN